MEKIPLGIGDSTQRVLFALNRAAFAIITARDDDDLFQRVCAAIAKDPVVLVAWIGFARNDPGKTIEVVARAGPCGGVLKEFPPSWGDGLTAGGPSGQAIRSGKIKVNNAIGADPTFAAVHDIVQRMGVNSAIAIPIAIEGYTSGVLTIATSLESIAQEAEFDEFALQCQGLAHGISLHQQRLRARQTEAWLAAIVQSSGDAIVGRDLAGRITSWNIAAERIFGYSMEEALGRSAQFFLTPPELQDEMVQLIERVKQGEDISHFETRRITKQGQLIDVALTLSPIRDPQGALVGISTITRDISAQKRIESRVAELTSELIHLSRVSELGQFASSLAHELNQPFTAILNYLEAAHQSLLSDEPARRRRGFDFLERAGKQTERAAEIVRRLRRLVEKAPREFVPAQLSEVVEEACVLASVGAKMDNIKIISQFDPGLPPVEVDKVEIQQVVVNLVRNAIEALQSVRTRTLTLRVFAGPQDQQEILVADTGAGVKGEIAPRLFMPFVTSKTGGMGLGLSISQSIIEAHGGRIWYEPNPGGGSVFRCSLPSLAAGSAV